MQPRGLHCGYHRGIPSRDRGGFSPAVSPPNPAMAPTVILPYCAIHPVFHVSQLKDFRGDYTPVFSKLYVHIDFSQ
jgi:hypothetical protein